MSFSINRRGFLLSLIALGASYTLAEDALPAQVDEVWTQALQSPWRFSVNEWGMITDPDFEEAKRWGDVFENIWVGGIRSWRDVISEVECCQPLVSHFETLADDEAERLDALTSEQLTTTERSILVALEEDRYEGWRAWIKLAGDPGVERFKQEITAWLERPADDTQRDWFPIHYGAQGQAKAFFERLDGDTLDALGVVIVEGEHPGSTYYAAELRGSVGDANAAAEKLELPFRFKAES
jgi:hypothetical protein